MMPSSSPVKVVKANTPAILIPKKNVKMMYASIGRRKSPVRASIGSMMTSGRFGTTKLTGDRWSSTKIGSYSSGVTRSSEVYDNM